MPVFNICPNLRVLNRYFTTSTDWDFDSHNPTYKPEPLSIEVEWQVFADETTFQDGFKSILLKYNIIEHYDNLLYLTLSTFDDVWQGIQFEYDEYTSKKRARDLAQMILLLKNTKAGKLFNVSFKSLTDINKQTDAVINEWIKNTLIEALESKKFPAGAFGSAALKMLSSGGDNAFRQEDLDVDKIERFAKIRLVNPKNSIKKGMVTISLMIFSYLQGETKLQAKDGVTFSDIQLNFIFDLLELLKQVDRLHIDSEPKDYLRVILQNYLR